VVEELLTALGSVVSKLDELRPFRRDLDAGHLLTATAAGSAAIGLAAERLSGGPGDAGVASTAIGCRPAHSRAAESRS
jgi:hypothetical protein